MRRSSCKSLFGGDPKAGLSGTGLPRQLLLNIETEEQLKIWQLNIACNNETHIAKTSSHEQPESPENYEITNTDIND